MKKGFLHRKKQEERRPHPEAADLLPIGSVVLLQDGEKKLMVMGIMQQDGTQGNFDYLGVLYPEGYLGPDNMYLFDHRDIARVFFRGYEDEERARFMDWLRNESF